MTTKTRALPYFSAVRREAAKPRPRTASTKVKFALLALLLLTATALYLTVGVRFDKPALLEYALRLRSVKVVVILLVAFAIGAASLVFQSIINNTIVTPCLLGMNSLYTLVHTAVAFFLGTGSVLLRNSNVAFAMDLVIMAVVATFVYSILFQKTRYNILYVLLIGTVLTSFFSSVQSTLIRAMDRDAAIGTEGAQLAAEVLDNELVNKTEAAANGRVVVLEHSNVWYTAEGGITALGTMLADLEGALLG